MQSKGHIGGAVLLAAFACFGISLIAQSGDTYKARLSAVPADAKTRPDLAGIGSATATLSGTKLTVNGTFEGLKTPATVARLHLAVMAGVRGPVLTDLTITKAVSGTISGSVDLTPAQIDNLKKGGIYVQIHSEKAPDGVLWGWLTR
jgi:CHRD domain